MNSDGPGPSSLKTTFSENLKCINDQRPLLRYPSPPRISPGSVPGRKAKIQYQTNMVIQHHCWNRHKSIKTNTVLKIVFKK